MSDLSGGFDGAPAKKPVITCGSLCPERPYEVSVHVTENDAVTARFATEYEALTWALHKARVHKGLAYEVRVVGADE